MDQWEEELAVQINSPLWTKFNTSRRCKTQLARIKEPNKGVLQHLRPHHHLLERTVREAANDGISDVSNTRLEGQQRLGKAVGRYFGREEFDEVGSNESRVGCFGCVLACVVWFRGFDDGYNAIGVDRDSCTTNPILRMDDELERK
jgi:hypothetical protein